MEFLDQQSGFILYEFPVSLEAGASNVLQLPAGSADGIYVFADSSPVVAFANRSSASSPIVWNSGAPATTLRILVENMGRVNFGAQMQDEHKGIQGSPTLNNKPLSIANISCFPLEGPPVGYWSPQMGDAVAAPSFFRFSLNISTMTDTFLRFDGWSKGLVWVNGFALGRYWQSSMPQKTMFVSKALLKPGLNQIVLFEQIAVPTKPTLTFDDHYEFSNKFN